MTIDHDLRPTELTTLLQRVEGTHRWKWIHHQGARIDWPSVTVLGGVLVGASAVGDIPPAVVVRACYEALERRRARRSAAATRAAATRARRQEKRVYAIARAIYQGDECDGVHVSRCRICGRGLTDTESVKRGIGSECWQDILKAMEALRRRQLPATEQSRQP